MWSDTQPKNGRVRPLVTRDKVSDSGSAAMPSTIDLATLILAGERPDVRRHHQAEVDISAIMTNSSQNTGLFSISRGV